MVRISVAVVTLIWVGWTVHAVGERAYPTLIALSMIFAGGLYVALGDRIASLIPAAQKWRVDIENRGLVVRPNRFRVMMFMAGVMSLLLGFFALGLLQMLGKLAAPGRSHPTSRDRALEALIPIVGVACGVLAVMIAVFFLLARGNTGSLVIAANGVTFWSRRSVTMPWEAVRSVALADGGLRAGDLVVDGEPAPLKLPMSLFPRDTEVLVEVLQFYWRNPGSRVELSNGQALARWQARDYASGPEIASR